MGDLANPTPAEREARQTIAAAIVESVQNDEKMPLPGLKTIAIQDKGVFFDAVEVETFVFHLAHEIVLLLEDLEERSSPATLEEIARLDAEIAQLESEIGLIIALREVARTGRGYPPADTDADEEQR